MRKIYLSLIAFMLIFNISANGVSSLILEYTCDNDIVGQAPQIDVAVGTTKFSGVVKDAASDIVIASENDNNVIRYYSTSAYSSGNLNVLTSKKADISVGKTVISTRIKAFNSTNSKATYYNKKMFPQIFLRIASGATKSPLFTMYNGNVTTGDVGGTAISGVKYENEWHDVVIIIDANNNYATTYYFDGVCVLENNPITINSAIDPKNLLVTFGGQYRAGDAECFYDDIKIGPLDELRFTLPKTQSVPLDESIEVVFNNPVELTTLLPEYFQISSDFGNISVSDVSIDSSKKKAKLKFDGILNPETEYTIRISMVSDIFGNVIDSQGAFVSAKPTVSISSAELYNSGNLITNLEVGELTTKINVKNLTDVDFSATIVSVLYDGSELLFANFSGLTVVSAGENMDLTCDLSISDLQSDNLNLRVFLLDDLVNINALNKEKVFVKSGVTPVFTNNKNISYNFSAEMVQSIATILVLNSDEAIAYIGQAVISADGKANFDFSLNKPKGVYKYKISDGISNITDSIIHYTATDVLEFLEFLKTASKTEFENELIKPVNLSILGISEKDYPVSTNMNSAKISELVYTEYSTATVEKNLDFVKNAYLRAYLTEFVNKSDSTSATQVLFEKMIITLDISKIATYEIYKNLLSNETKLKVLEALLGNNYVSLSEVQNAFNLNIVTKGIKYAPNWGSVAPVIAMTEEKLALGINLTKYRQLMDSSVVDAAMLNTDYSSLTALKDDYNKKIDTQYSNENPIGGVVSGGGTSGGGGTITAPILSKVIEPIKPVPTPESEKLYEFSDLDQTPWAIESILNLKNKGIVSGREKDKFYPNDLVTRAEFVKMLIVALDIEDENSRCDFSDVNTEDWYYTFVGTAYEANIVNGIGDKIFGVETKIKREDIAVMISRAFIYLEVSDNDVEVSDFNDKDLISDYALEAVTKMKQFKIINGKDNGNFEPQAYATRAETAYMINNMLKSIEELYTKK